MPMQKQQLPDEIGVESSFNAHRPKALLYPAEKLPRGRGDSIRARHNLYEGLRALDPFRAELEKKWNRERVAALFADADVADGLVFASQRVQRIDAAEKTLRDDMSRAYVVRDLLLSALECAAKFDLIPTTVVQALRAGTGALDAALDLIGAVAVYREHAKALAGKTPVTPELLDVAQTLGNSLQARITPTGQKPAASKELDAKDAAIELELRFYALVADKHHEARQAGREIWGRAMPDHVPALQAVAVKPKPKTGASTEAQLPVES